MRCERPCRGVEHDIHRGRDSSPQLEGQRPLVDEHRQASQSAQATISGLPEERRNFRGIDYVHDQCRGAGGADIDGGTLGRRTACACRSRGVHHNIVRS